MLHVPGLRYGNPKLPTIPHGAGVAVERLEALELVPAWNGALEKAGDAPGLSSYRGRSSVYHSPAWGDAPAFGECRKIWEKSPPLTEEKRVQVRSYLHAGWSLRRVATRVGVKVGMVRRQRALMDAERAQ